MVDEIEKSEPSPDDVLAAITSFNDPAIITNIFRELGWTYSFEIKEWLTMAKQNANLSVKSKALIQLRTLLREAAESAGYIANVSSTAPNARGGHTTFQAKCIAGALNPVKKIESTIKESQNDKPEERTEPNRGSDRGQSERPESTREIHEGISNGTDTGSQFPPEPERNAGRADSERDVVSGGTEPPDGEETSGRTGRGTNTDGGSSSNDDCSDKDCIGENSRSSSSELSVPENPCIKTRPPTAGKGDLFPGVASTGDS